MTTTRFTLNKQSLEKKFETLCRLKAVLVFQHQTKWIPAPCDCCGLPDKRLPEAATFVVEGDFSRNALKKLFGKEAMVRGVKKL